MSMYSIECPRCREALTFRANQGEEFECAECGLDLEVDEGEVLYDPAAARLRPIDYVCPCCQSELSVYAVNGEGVECPDCSFEVVIEGRRAYYNEDEIEAQERELLEELEPDSESSALAIVRNAIGAEQLAAPREHPDSPGAEDLPENSHGKERDAEQDAQVSAPPGTTNGDYDI